MFYSLLDLLACPACLAPLALRIPTEAPRSTSMRTADERDRRIAIREGVLVCTACRSWYPVRDGVPELLPAHLRDWASDRQWLRAREAAMAAAGLAETWRTLVDAVPAAPPADEGAHYKLAEIDVARRTLPAGFFDWARVAPFSPSRPHYSFDLLARYVTTVSRLDCGVSGLVFDLGCGTGWTTEWLVRLGYRAVGMDLCRDYILAGMARRGEHLPHFVVGDVEHLPLRNACVDAILSFDAFHHVPDRCRAMAEFARIMRPGATMALTEPGIEHEHAAVSVNAMRQHGILERGFDEAGLAGYAAGTALGDIRHFRSDTHPHDIYTVRKQGAFEIDSLTPRAMVADISTEPSAPVAAGQPLLLTVTIQNRGDTTWIADTGGAVGEVQLGAQLFDRDHRLLNEDYARVKLPRTVRPGDLVRFRCALPPLLEPGDYLVELDMIDLGYLWFKEYGYQPTAWPVTVKAAPGSGNTAAPAGERAAPIVPEPLPIVVPWPAPATDAPPPAPPPTILEVWRTRGTGPAARRIPHAIWRRIRARAGVFRPPR